MFLCEIKDVTEALKVIKNFLDERNYKSYYTRMWTDENGARWFDVGSWSEFFVMYEDEKKGVII